MAIYTTSFAVDQSLKQVFAAINNVRGWWSGDIEGRTDKPGAEFAYRYEDIHRSTQKITQWVPGKKVVWRVLDARISFVKGTAEWNSADIIFEIARKGEKTELRFTHMGLLPRIECYGSAQALGVSTSAKACAA